ncbi:MAG TPA: protein translocase subunit SecD [Longimicrobiales bacterium]|nr:protein translocase subunit SecD [Longimicrobiales bacterium]
MFGTLKGRILVILAVLLVAAGFLWKNGLKLGLDLQGGMHLALEVADSAGTLTPAAKADATDRALQIVRNRIDQFGVEEPLVQKVGSDRIIVELAGIRDPQRAKNIIEQTAYLQFLLVQDGRDVNEALPRIDRAIVATLGPGAAAPAARQGPQQPRELNQLIFGQKDSTAKRDSAAQNDTTKAGADTSAAAVASTDTSASAQPFSSLLLEGGQPGEYLVPETDVPTLEKYLALPAVQRLLPRETQLLLGAKPEGRGATLYRRVYALDKRPFLTGDLLEDAQAGRDPQFNQTIVSFTLNRRGGRTFERVTSQHIGDRISIVLDNQVYSAPVVRSTISNRGQIEMGQAPLDQARDLALVLRAGALPAPLHVVEERTIGPSLGADSVLQGQIAGLVGVLLVILIMIGYYHFAGFLAIVGMLAYVVVVLGGLAAFKATLTAPGIAGFILSVGMGVDANVLQFERIREELIAGRTVRAAVDAGFSEAMSAIIDTHLTTLITALILYYVGTGPVRGFAVTLSVGIIASFFSAVFVTRTLFMAYMQRRQATAPLSI